MQLLEEQRETWGTRGGFVLAAIGSAVGLGNLWGFPYKLYSYGGGAFLIPYIIAMFCIGIPLLILEFSLGHFTQRAAPDAFRRANKRLEFVGWWGIILGFVIITYYPTILAYCFSYMGDSLAAIFTGAALPWAGEGAEGVRNASKYFFEDYLAGGEYIGPFRGEILFMLILAWILMYFCIFRGVKLVGKIVWLTVPLPWIMLLILAIRGLTLEGSMKGLAFYLDPDWTQLAKPSTWRFAFGQVFFSLSLAFGVMLTYASFLHRKSDINNNAAIIGIADFATSFIGGIAIFATIGGMAHVTSQAGQPVPVNEVIKGGPGLAFVAFPYALAQLPGAAWWSLIFFFMLITLGIDSAFSITESVLAGIVDKTGWRRDIVLPVMSLVGIGTGLMYVTIDGLSFLGTIDGFVNGTWGIAFIGLIECVALGWFSRLDVLRDHANERSDWRLGRWWNLLIRVMIPVVLGTLFFWSLYDNVQEYNAGKFLRDINGQWIINDCVGMGIMVLACVLAVTMSLIRSPHDKTEKQARQQRIEIASARSWGIAGFVLACLAGLIFIPIFLFVNTNAKEEAFLFASFLLGAASLLMCHGLLERFDNGVSRPSGFARLGGVMAIVDISVCLLVILVALSGKVADTQKTPVEHADHLSQTSYIILGVVFVLIVFGLGWCFWKAIGAVAKNEPEQQSEEEPLS
ncbi:MAG: sodium-dependent transporter [Phycisphaerae bacterium]|nr:sodium-dependent transporter [Phycisphaerae bacterium]